MVHMFRIYNHRELKSNSQFDEIIGLNWMQHFDGIEINQFLSKCCNKDFWELIGTHHYNHQ